MERPVSITNFERCYLGALVVGLISTAINWNTVIAMSSANPAAAQFGPGFISTMLIGGTIIGIAIRLALWFAAARKHAVVAKWIIVVLFAISAAGLVWSLLRQSMPGGLIGVFTVVGFLLDAAAVWFLFRPDARVWFGETRVA
ncbi:MAG: hypothetical protein M3R41_01000 [Pseudomonadota bacterium]|nr:hypothetical protein [Pseudomonadota bacterium]